MGHLAPGPQQVSHAGMQRPAPAVVPERPSDLGGSWASWGSESPKAPSGARVLTFSEVRLLQGATWRRGQGAEASFQDGCGEGPRGPSEGSSVASPRTQPPSGAAGANASVPGPPDFVSLGGS